MIFTGNLRGTAASAPILSTPGIRCRLPWFSMAWGISGRSGKSPVPVRPRNPDPKQLIANRRDYFETIEKNELIDAAVCQRRQIDLSRIEIPVLSCGNGGGSALRLRGNTEGFPAS